MKPTASCTNPPSNLSADKTDGVISTSGSRITTPTHRRLHRSAIAALVPVLALALGACVEPGTSSGVSEPNGTSVVLGVGSGPAANCAIAAASSSSTFSVTCPATQETGNGPIGKLLVASIGATVPHASQHTCIFSGQEASYGTILNFNGSFALAADGAGTTTFDLYQGGNVNYKVNCGNGQTITGSM